MPMRVGMPCCNFACRGESWRLPPEPLPPTRPEAHGRLWILTGPSARGMGGGRPEGTPEVGYLPCPVRRRPVWS